MTINEAILKSYLVRKLTLFQLPLERADVRQILNANYNDTGLEILSEMISFTEGAMYDTVRYDKEQVINYEEHSKKILSELNTLVKVKKTPYRFHVESIFDYSTQTTKQIAYIGDEPICYSDGRYLSPNDYEKAYEIARLKGFHKVRENEYIFTGETPKFKDIKEFFEKNYSSDFYKEAFFNLLALLKNHSKLKENASDYFSSIVKDRNLSLLMNYFFNINEDRTEE